MEHELIIAGHPQVDAKFAEIMHLLEDITREEMRHMTGPSWYSEFLMNQAYAAVVAAHSAAVKMATRKDMRKEHFKTMERPSGPIKLEGS